MKSITKEPSQNEVNRFLDDLRRSNLVNMYGAFPYVAEAYGITKAHARDMCAVWMKQHAQEEN